MTSQEPNDGGGALQGQIFTHEVDIVQRELMALRDSREATRQEREKKWKRRRFLLHKKLESDVIESIPEWRSAATPELRNTTDPQRSQATSQIPSDQTNPANNHKKRSESKSRLRGSKEKNKDTETEKTGVTQGQTTPSLVYKNDYSQHFVDTNQRPQNFIRDTDLADRFEEYPKLRELIQLKDQAIREQATPVMYMKVDLKTCDLAATLGTKFDVILIDPPWEEYSRRDPSIALTSSSAVWSLEEMMQLKIEQIADSPSFLWLWVGSAEGLDQGRQLLKKWGFRRCEDICWLKTNKKGQQSTQSSNGVFQHTKEHCLMGIKGTVRRNQDSHFIHANIDTDIIIEEEGSSSIEKPVELYHIIEHFCLGRRRLELFGRDHNIRPGWVTLGIDIASSNYSATTYKSYFTGENGNLLTSSAEIENLRPKSPTRSGGAPQSAPHVHTPPASYPHRVPHRPPHSHPSSSYISPHGPLPSRTTPTNSPYFKPKANHNEYDYTKNKTGGTDYPPRRHYDPPFHS